MSDFVLIPLNGRVGSGLSAKVDAADAALVEGHSWALDKGKRSAIGYAATSRDGHTLSMHRLIMDPPNGLWVDHISGDTLDNRRENLRLVTPGQNTLNKAAHGKASQYKGVSRAGAGWRVAISIERSRLRIDGIPSEEEAARLYDALALHLHGIYARINFANSIPMTPDEARQKYPQHARLLQGERRTRRSEYKGVYLQRGRWCAQLWHDSKVKHLGFYPSELEAAHAYDAAARQLRGPSAKLNFP